jgi:arylsulfatase A-like enzyme
MPRSVNPKRRYGILAVALSLFAASAIADTTRPNIVLIMTDDQGYGEASCYVDNQHLPTPGIDRIAREGMRFTDAHSASAVCTPTRYGLLTGRYPWRTHLQSGVLSLKSKKLTGPEIYGYGDECLIRPGTTTLASLLKEKGYQTAMVGKWHLGCMFHFPAGKTQKENALPPVGSTVLGGPCEYGFDQYWGPHHAREIRTWIENRTVTQILKEDSEVLPKLTQVAVDYIESQHNARQPFFLYVPLTSPHTPHAPSEAFQGKSSFGTYGDFVMETDNTVEQILNALDRIDASQNTLVIFTCDNGTSRANKMIDKLRAQGFDPLAGLRGSKSDAWEGGHRVPYVVRWPAVIEAGQVSDALICHNNNLATFAEIVGRPLSSEEGTDSFSILPLLIGEAKETHPYVIHATITGHLSLRTQKWKFISTQGSGGWTRGGDEHPFQLYKMDEDRNETTNLYPTEPERVEQMKATLVRLVEQGYSVEGKQGQNDVEVQAIKKPRKRK